MLRVGGWGLGEGEKREEERPFFYESAMSRWARLYAVIGDVWGGLGCMR